MREQLAALAGDRRRFRAVFVRFGSRPVWRNFREPTVLLRQIALLDGTPVCDHLWFSLTAGFEALSLAPGDMIAFDARSRSYHKQIIRTKRGVMEAEMDWHLAYPTRLVKLASGLDVPMPAYRERFRHAS